MGTNSPQVAMPAKTEKPRNPLAANTKVVEASSAKQFPGLIRTLFIPENDPFFWNYKIYFQN